jgi:hypothetical protein
MELKAAVKLPALILGGPNSERVDWALIPPGLVRPGWAVPMSEPLPQLPGYKNVIVLANFWQVAFSHRVVEKDGCSLLPDRKVFGRLPIWVRSSLIRGSEEKIPANCHFSIFIPVSYALQAKA